jgi:hypothetical protein
LFTPDKDLTTISQLMRKDEPLLELLNLKGADAVTIAKRIIKRSQWSDLATSERRLCVYFLPDRRMRNESFKQSVLQVDCHVPAVQDYIAYRVLERVYTLLHRKRLNKRYIFFDGQLGELPTMQGFFCAGSRFEFKRII